MSRLSETLPVLDARSLAGAVTRRELSLADVAEAFIEAVEARNPAINALIRFDADAVRRQVAELEALRRSGRPAPLLGVPFSVKDTIWVQGQKACQGSKLFADFVAPAPEKLPDVMQGWRLDVVGEKLSKAIKDK